MPSTGITPPSTGPGTARECGAGNIPGSPSLEPGAARGRSSLKIPTWGMAVEPGGGCGAVLEISRSIAQTPLDTSQGTFWGLSAFPRPGAVPRSSPEAGRDFVPLCCYPKHKSRLPFPVIASNPIPFPFQEPRGAGAVLPCTGAPLSSELPGSSPAPGWIPAHRPEPAPPPIPLGLGTFSSPKGQWFHKCSSQGLWEPAGSRNSLG